ncbi:hypothetical protein C9374_009067 [Naegleria lovaniensis]|uniref:Uncharacterized protein n=1 Tax=Naegleria lovaniensis TaxID=51637 RepID=A0AA88GI12_NAELO|nr:uncharacterized protein C9374_009067 [Naegleria lovaniensis]KAG2377551.1 hypothetical protein C9374_009067 [Naegleria lovaniensis]
MMLEQLTQYAKSILDPNSPLSSVAMIMSGCVLNVIVLEMILNLDSKMGPLLTLIQFIFISLESLRHNIDWETKSLKKRAIPLWFYSILVFLFFFQSVVNNLVFKYHISIILHTIFRSSSLLMNLLIGILLFGKSQPKEKIISVLMITIGIFIAVVASNKSESIVFGQEIVGTAWVMGLILLTASQFSTGLLGNLQSYGYSKYGTSDENENIFYSHLLSIPCFIFFKDDLVENFETMQKFPILYWYMLLSVLTQIVCIKGVYRLTAQTNSLTTTLTITIRKFVSLLFSIFYFGNTFTWLHAIGTFLVFYGTHLFVQNPKSTITNAESARSQSLSSPTTELPSSTKLPNVTDLKSKHVQN